VVNEAIALIPAGFDLVVVHLPQTDQTGHASGWMSAEYVAQVQQTDEAVGRMVSLLPPETTIVVTADHGAQRPRPARPDTPAELRRQARERSVRAPVAAGLPALPLPREAPGSALAKAQCMPYAGMVA